MLGSGRRGQEACCRALSARQNGVMVSVHIRNLPEGTLSVLRRRAAAAHQSLQEYLRAWLIAEAARSTLDEVLDRAGGRAGGSVSFAGAAAAVRRDRARH
jgi:plasmid stability protein